MTVYSIKLHTLTPLHIGDGNELRQDFDFAVHAGRTYRLNEDEILLAKAAALQPDPGGAYPPPGRLLSEADFEEARYFRYVLHGEPRSKKVDARLRSFIKDVFDRPYIPGSSLKGALRTALAWSGWPEINPRLDRNAIDDRKSWAGQPLEKKLFGKDPNHDLLRALQVADLHGPQHAGQGLVIANAQVLTRRSAGSPIELEAVRGDTTFEGTLVVDETLFSPLAERELGFSNRRKWLDELARRVQAHSQARIGELALWFEEAEGCKAVADFYHQLAAVQLPPNQALLQLGWGAGWDSKTFWTRLQSDPDFFEGLVRKFNLHRAGKNSPPRSPGDPFPRSKRAAMSPKDKKAVAAPFGWVLLEMEKA